MLKYVEENGEAEQVEKLICFFLDKEQAWADTWTEFVESLDSGVSLNANFQPLDGTEPNSWEFQKKFLQAVLFTISYFVSVVRSLDSNGVVTGLSQMLFENAKEGAYIFYDGNGHKDFNSYFDEHWSDAGVQCLASEDNVQ